jgi:hypothetical protein
VDYESWCSLSEEELGKRDIAEVNLAAAFDLPRAGALDVARLCKTVDRWADLVALAADNGFRTFRRRYAEYSDDQFRMLVLVTVLQRNLGVRYNLSFNEGVYDASDSRNLFIHGLLTGHGGTCATMPVLYTAVGRRLGYPLKIVKAKKHLFCRWDGEERFNIEATSPGFRPLTDDDFRYGRNPISDEEMSKGLYLRSLSPREELGFFLQQRFKCCIDNFLNLHALKSAYHAAKVAPSNQAQYDWGFAITMYRAVEELKRQRARNPTLSELVMPRPVDKWDEDFFPDVRSDLLRILSNRTAKQTKAVLAHVFEEMASVADTNERTCNV